MTRLPKLIQFPVLLGLACLIAGLFGMIHNQVSYTLGPDYFHAFKFIQFNVIEGFQPRLAALIIGWKASWWMGAIIGLPLFLLALLAPDRTKYFRLCIMALVTVIGTTLAADVLAMILTFLFLTPENMPAFLHRPDLTDPLGFTRAGILHDTSYLGGLIGLLLAAIRIISHLRHKPLESTA